MDPALNRVSARGSPRGSCGRTSLTALLALVSAVLIGGADYLGGVASRNASATRVAAGSQVVGRILIVPLSLLVGWETVTRSDIGWSLAAGVSVGLGPPLFYAAMTRGLISIVAPVTGMTGAAVPVAFSLARGERPGSVALIGIAVALVAIAMVSIVPGETTGAATALPLAIASGILFGPSSWVSHSSTTRPGCGRSRSPTSARQAASARSPS